jgi:pimeloyl-ACP methyl ester carboxylesterase
VSRVSANGVELEVERLGDAGAPPLLLINGLGSQLVRWGDAFCQLLVDRDLHVIRYDQRDAGLSTKLVDFDIARVRKSLGRALRGEPAEVPYGLEDMADDAAALIAGLGLESAHVAGASLGGMVGQLLAIRHPERVRSFTSIMSTTGDRSLPKPTREATKVLMTMKPGDREGFIEYEVRSTRTFHGDVLPFDEGYVRDRGALEYDRAYEPDGTARQLLASFVATSRREPLRKLRVPTLVIHGDQDPLIRPECGLDTQRCIPGAKLHVVAGMGHDLCSAAWDEIAGAITDHATTA